MRRKRRSNRKSISEVLHEVDPNLKIIEGGIRYKYRLNQEDWDASGGAICPRCKEETVRFRSEDGICRRCADLLNEKQDRDEKKRARQIKFIKQHNARIEKQKRATY